MAAGRHDKPDAAPSRCRVACEGPSRKELWNRENTKAGAGICAGLRTGCVAQNFRIRGSGIGAGASPKVYRMPP
jgi:hypothetical protein